MIKQLALLFAFFLFLCGCEGSNHAEGGIWDETENALAFQVVDSAGKPVIHARVRLVSIATWSEKIFTGKNTVTDSGNTNASGWIQLHSTSWPAYAEVNTGAMVARSLVSRGGDSIQATVGEPALLQGSLAVRGKPWPAQMHLFGTSYEAKVRQDGSFSFDSLPRGEYALVAEQGTELLLWGQGIISDTAQTALIDSLSPCDQDSVLMDDFEDNDDANRLHSLTGAGWWYTYSDSLSSVTPFLHADGLILSEESWNGTQSYHAIYNVNTAGPGAYALCGFDIGVSRLSDTTATYDLSSLDSITFWAKGEGDITMQVYSLRTLQADSAGKWENSFSLSSEWTHVVIHPDENWENIATYANTITFISEKNAEIWLDQIVFHGISAADIFPFQLRYSL